ncbi:DUF4439 domain-containing protein [Arthrobacter sp. MPF02]|uniref:DUF4439 domain-containing protein n=1 Tax=Arthrobacter sp. MPF02 TaxID=3388492 RepID=UPI003985455A
MNDDSQVNRTRIRYFRYVVLALAALLVVSLGFAFIRAEPPPPPPPPFSERARAAALADALQLRMAGLRLAGGTADAGAAAALDRIVTLLTIQARTLLLPEAAAAGTGVPSASAEAAAPASSAAPALTTSGLAAALATSGGQRLKDAETVDGGMARLLAGAGTAQMLAAQQLAAAAGEPDAVSGLGPAAGPTAAEAATDAAETGCPSPSRPPVSPGQQPSAAGTGPGDALAAAVAAELEAVYGYQAALTRLPPEAAGPASEFLGQHHGLAREAEKRSLFWCGTPLPQQPGYVLEPQFLASPSAGLARLEAGTLPAYGDVVAVTDGSTRRWAIAALRSAVLRTVHWGGDPGPVPGLPLDEQQLPPLPA